MAMMMETVADPGTSLRQQLGGRTTLDTDAEAGWSEISGKAVAGRLFGTGGGGIVGRSVSGVVDAVLWIARGIHSVHRRWSAASGEMRLKMLGGVGFWILCAAVVGAMWIKAGHEAAEAARLREYVARGSCAVCIDNAGLDISLACKPTTEHDITTHADKLSTLLTMLDRHLADGHKSITAASVGSRACVLAVVHSLGSWFPASRETLVMYNPVEVDPNGVYDDEVTQTQQTSPATSPSPPPPAVRPGQVPPSGVKIKVGDQSAKNSPEPQETGIPAPRLRVDTLTYEEPSDFYPGVTVERARPSIAKIRYAVPDLDTGTYRTKYAIFASYEAVCVLHAIEVLNGTHHVLYHR
jgi:hypothetical protein